ncbi:MAG: UDP-N-acetylmuramate dehydrogenase [Pirellulaceae bacterium]
MGLLSGLEHFVTEAEPLAAHTWLRLGGPAKYFAEPTNQDELATLVTRCCENEVPVRLLGGGSNVLVRDRGVDGMVVLLTAPAFGEIAVKGNIVRAGGGARLGHVVSTSVREGLAGLEQLVGIPGSVGGALHGNAGDHGADVGQVTCSATVMTRAGEVLTRGREEMNFAYRSSSLDELVILEAQFELESEDPAELTRRMQKQWILKKASQPLSNENVGCVFKSPGGISAASLIEQAGLKGATVGGATVSDRDANFIVAGDGATSDDVLQLIEMLRSEVSQRLGVELELQLDVW